MLWIIWGVMTRVSKQSCVRWHLRLLICVSCGPRLPPLPRHRSDLPRLCGGLRSVSRLLTVNVACLVCSVCAAKGRRCQSSQIASAPPPSARMSPTVAESGAGNYRAGAGCVCEFLCARCNVHGNRFYQCTLIQKPTKLEPAETSGSFLTVTD